MDDHEHSHDHTLAHHNHSHQHPHHHSHNPSPAHNHAHPHDAHPTRRDFLRALFGGALAGASILELAYHRAAWARAAGADSGPELFDIEKVADGIYFAQARPQAMTNCNASIYVGAKDVVVVDAHSKPSAAACLIAQIKREITEKPVRYVINTHFHWDHTQGNHAYRVAEQKIDFIASNTTKKLMSEMAVARMKASVAQVPQQVDELRARAAKSNSAAEKAFCADQIRQLEAYQAELKNYTLELPTITFDKTYLLKDPAHDLHIEFHGHAHTAGDVVVFCPQKRTVSSGDVIHGFFPFIADGFPNAWPGTIQSIGQLEFTKILPGHASLQTGRTIMTNMSNYIEELTGKVQEGKKAGLTVPELQQKITVASLKSLQSNGYGEYILHSNERFRPHFGPVPPLQVGVNTNIGEIYKNLDRL
ncbi:MAG TPA: MBL fold metallo-hydrolase [Acidobacteriaceae bacterium]